ncbi:MAG: arsenic resistance protein [Acetobacteraceae bacterium]|nr:arsenic resistance protein [Acetobacteraceae bacterium]
MNRAALERFQLPLYLASLAAGLGLGQAVPGLSAAGSAALWPALAALLFVTFTQVPLGRLPGAFADGRFLAALCLGNLVLLPVLVAVLLPFAGADPAIRIAVLLVLLAPCTDWFVTFAARAGGDAPRAIAATPLLLAAQMLLLPPALWWLAGAEAAALIRADAFLLVFAVLILLPLLAAWALERAAGRSARAAGLVIRLGDWPVPLLCLVLLAIGVAEAASVLDAASALAPLVPLYAAFALGAAAGGVALARAFRLPHGSGRVVLFSLSTRNSFVVLPFALALPPPAREVAAAAIVLQSFVELLAILLLLRAAPRLLPERP